MKGGVTIGQAAAFAGITVKTVRHYHRLGLVEEPSRDSSGYRRYGSPELLRLVKVKTLAAAGVPLAEIGPLLEADAEPFAATLADVQRRLTDRIEDLMARREMLARLADGNRALLPDRALVLLDRIHGLGLTPDEVATCRDGLVLARALVPEGFDDHLSRVERALGDTLFVALHKRCWECATWEPDDPRIDELATTVAEQYLANPAWLEIIIGLRPRTEAATRYRLITDFGAGQAPAWARLNALFASKLRAAGVSVPHERRRSDRGALGDGRW